MEQGSIKSLTEVVNCLITSKSSQMVKDAQTPNRSGLNLAITTEALQERTQSDLTGLPHGEIGYATTTTGRQIQIKINVDRMGVATEPRLTQHQASLLDDAAGSKNYLNVKLPVIPDEKEEELIRLYIQGMANLKPAPDDLIIRKLTSLKLQRPTQNMSSVEIEIFMNDLTDQIIDDGYCFESVEQGINNILKFEDGAFFPTYKIMRKYISPIHYKKKTRIDMLGELLENKHKGKF